MPTATVLRESALPAHCPLRDPGAMAAYKAAVRAGSDLSLRTQGFLTAKTRAEAGEWLAECMRQSKLLFQPWSMEILFLAGTFGSVRFSELEDLLGASSRTLSVKLRNLCAAGYLERRVEAGPPLRTSYVLTKQGRATAAVASPLMAHLNLAAVGALATR